MTTFVLIHGAWHGAWCWYKLIPELENAGHKVIAPDLPGLGRDRTPISDISLGGWADHVSKLLQSENEPLILVGHSRGGIVISEVAERISNKIKCLVYMTAFLVPSGTSALELIQNDTESLLVPNLNFDEERGFVTVADSAIAEVFYGDCPAEDKALAKSLLLPEPIAPGATPLSLTNNNFGQLSRVYIECLRDKAISPALQKQMYTAQQCEKIISMDTDHSPFFSRPKDLAAHLLELA